ncbi:hypothetical protein HNP12_000211 [Aeromonas hydrophila]|uniref:hypothetical protein n=1 Tax=Aeromonas hydrophila TaxID=644 RepID=UPI00216A9AA2|nr:hypothetical protein [Aeromonas hydrophila]MCS3766172.1 hypothetical protein [Aeromonas hydrophila]
MEFTLNDIKKLMGKTNVVKYQDHDIYIKTPSSVAWVAYQCAALKVSEVTPAQRENAVNAANKELIMGGVCNSRWELLFPNEKSYKEFAINAPTDLVDLLVYEINKLVLGGDEKKESSEPSMKAVISKTESE